MRMWILLLLLATPALAEGDGANAVITNSGSTNMPGFTIVVRPDGWATYTPAPPRFAHPGGPTATEHERLLPAGLSVRFFKDLATAAPLSKYPAVHCIKSASFGFTETVRYSGHTSPDLTCPNVDARLKSVSNDVHVVVQACRKP